MVRVRGERRIGVEKSFRPAILTGLEAPDQLGAGLVELLFRVVINGAVGSHGRSSAKAADKKTTCIPEKKEPQPVRWVWFW
jgi:hypothetical protein